MPGNVVCQGAQCQCNQGAAPTPLTVTSQQIEKIEGYLVATIMDYAPTVNVQPFGVCQMLTSAAAGVPTPCVPAPPAPWTPGSTLRKINGFAVLTSESKLACTVGGEISIQQPNCGLDVETQ